MEPLRIQKSKHTIEPNTGIYRNNNLGNISNIWEVNLNKLVANMEKIKYQIV